MGDPVTAPDTPAHAGRPPPRVLVAGVGNLFLGDDGFGPEVARRLQARGLPAHARVHDYGVGGIHLAYDVVQGVDLLVLVDTIDRGLDPGTVVLLEVGENHLGMVQVDAHAMDPVAMLATVETLGGERPRTLLVGCQPASLGERMGLSPVVEDAVDHAVESVVELVEDVQRTAELATTGMSPRRGG